MIFFKTETFGEPPRPGKARPRPRLTESREFYDTETPIPVTRGMRWFTGRRRVTPDGSRTSAAGMLPSELVMTRSIWASFGGGLGLVAGLPGWLSVPHDDRFVQPCDRRHLFLEGSADSHDASVPIDGPGNAVAVSKRMPEAFLLLRSRFDSRFHCSPARSVANMSKNQLVGSLGTLSRRLLHVSERPAVDDRFGFCQHGYEVCPRQQSSADSRFQDRFGESYEPLVEPTFPGGQFRYETPTKPPEGGERCDVWVRQWRSFLRCIREYLHGVELGCVVWHYLLRTTTPADEKLKAADELDGWTVCNWFQMDCSCRQACEQAGVHFLLLFVNFHQHWPEIIESCVLIRLKTRSSLLRPGGHLRAGERCAGLVPAARHASIERFPYKRTASRNPKAWRVSLSVWLTPACMTFLWASRTTSVPK